MFDALAEARLMARNCHAFYKFKGDDWLRARIAKRQVQLETKYSAERRTMARRIWNLIKKARGTDKLRNRVEAEAFWAKAGELRTKYATTLEELREVGWERRPRWKRRRRHARRMRGRRGGTSS
jgi:hypothetical protein